MEYQVGNVLVVDEERYKVLGKICYRNVDDNCRWMEYRLKPLGGGGEAWLSVDEAYDEYSISRSVKNVTLDGYKQVDSGTQEVVEVWGRVDVEVGDRAGFVEYEDEAEERIISEEVWADGREVSLGYYLDWHEISQEQETSENGMYRNDRIMNSAGERAQKKTKVASVIIFLVLAGMVVFVVRMLFMSGSKHSIAEYLKANPSLYEYQTSITGNGREKADVYRSINTLDMTAKAIIDAIEGDTTDVQQNTDMEDQSVAILTDDEYCLVYIATDKNVFVQISSRKFAYTSDATPYRCYPRTHRYYRGFYFARGFYRDRSHYSSYNSPYSDYDGDTVNYSANDPYNTYSSNIRQSSVGNRLSSGGGLSSGK